MKRTVLLFIALASLVVFTGTSHAQIKFALGFQDCQKIVGAPGSKVQFDIIATLTQSDFEVDKGASGFSIGFRAENVDLLGLPGASLKNKPPNGDQTTASSGAKCGTGQVVIPLDDFFCSVSTVDPDKIPDKGPIHDLGLPQGEGYVDGLAFDIGSSLEGNGTFVVGKIKGEVTIPASGKTTGRLYFADGLQGPGQVVDNGITSGGKTVKVDSGRLTLGQCVFDIEAEPPVINVAVDADQTEIPGAPGEKASGVAYISVDSQLKDPEGVSGWQFSLGYNNVINIKSITATPALFNAVPDLGGQLGFNETYTSETTPPLYVNPDKIYQVNDPAIEADCDLTVGQPQGKGIVSGVVFALPPTPGKAEYLPGTSNTRVFKIEFEQAQAFSTPADAPQVASFEWKDCLQGPGVKLKNGLTVKGNTIRPKNRTDLSITFKAGQRPSAAFRSGDGNNDGKTNIADPIFLINALFRGGPPCACADACDSNGDHDLGLADAVYTIMYLFDNKPAPVGGLACHRSDSSTPESCPAGSTSCD